MSYLDYRFPPYMTHRGMSNLKLLTRNSDWAIWGDKATGTSKGTNSPQVNPIQDLVGNADGTLQGFAFTTASGYVDVVAPNGKTVTGLQGDGVNDVVLLPNSPSIDITGTGDFAIGVVFKTGNSIAGFKTILCKDLNAVANAQYGLFSNDGVISCRVEGNFIGLSSTVIANAFYSAILYRVSGILKFRLNKLTNYQQPNVLNITSKPNFRILALASNDAGTVHASFSDYWIGTMKIINGAITPFTEAQLIKDWDSFCAKAYGL